MASDNLCFSANPALDLKDFIESKKYSHVAVLADENTYHHCLPVISPGLPARTTVITVKSGEQYKNLATCESIWQSLTDAEMDRHGVLVVIGGGVLGDMGGFCAATFKRGIDFILVPTTLLSQVDASVGGKLGVDFRNFKNHIGVFAHPALTIISSVFLKTLVPAELKSGYAEIIKHNLIDAESSWEMIRKTPFDKLPWEKLIRHSVEFKKSIVAEDPREKGIRKILNAGHTIGHAIETMLLNKGASITHGEAVAAGLVMEGWISNQKGMLSAEDLTGIHQHIREIFGKLKVGPADIGALMTLMRQDKKNRDGKILCVLLEKIGVARWDCEIREGGIEAALGYYEKN